MEICRNKRKYVENKQKSSNLAVLAIMWLRRGYGYNQKPPF